MNELISIVVPVYNVEQYLDKCIESIVDQTYSKIEIILVDDGSEDSSGSICDRWRKKDNRIRVIHKRNEGLSSARNAGLDASLGDYIGFIDSDDYIENTMYERLLNAIKKDDADIAICNYDFVDSSNNLIKNENVIKNQVLPKTRIYDKLINENYFYYVTAVNKLYRKRIFINVEFPFGKIHEDEYTVHHLFDNCDKISMIADTLYHYVQRNNSIMNSTITIKKLDAAYAFLDRYHFAKEMNKKVLADYTTKQAYGVMITCLKNLSILENLEELTRLLMALLTILKLNPRSVKLLMIFIIKFCYEIIVKYKFKINLNKDLFKAMNKEKVFFLATPAHGNLGDHAIVYSQYKFFEKYFPNKKIIEIRSVDYIRYKKYIMNKIKLTDWIVIDGGGNLGTLWPKEDDKITDIINRFKRNKIIVFPQTCYYDSNFVSIKRLKHNYEIYKGCNDLYMMFRDQKSYLFAEEYFNSINKYYVPDIVLTISDLSFKNKRAGVLLCFRNDIEKVVADENIEKLKKYLYLKKIMIDNISTVIDKNINKKDRKKELYRIWKKFSSANLVITDRLHGMIFSAITGTPCIALDNSSKKVSGVYEWLKKYKYIKCIKEFDDIFLYIDELYSLNEQKYIFESDMFFKEIVKDLMKIRN